MEVKPSVFYATDGRGRWWRTETQAQCSDKDILCDLPCQGVFGHKGPHWAYKPNGSYAYWLNESDPDSIEADVGAGWTPPDHKSYIHPKDKSVECYTNFRSTEEVCDRGIIEKLENNDPPEEDAGIDRPLSAEEVERLKEDGIL